MTFAPQCETGLRQEETMVRGFSVRMGNLPLTSSLIPKRCCMSVTYARLELRVAAPKAYAIQPRISFPRLGSGGSRIDSDNFIAFKVTTTKSKPIWLRQTQQHTQPGTEISRLPS